MKHSLVTLNDCFYKTKIFLLVVFPKIPLSLLTKLSLVSLDDNKSIPFNNFQFSVEEH